MEWEGEEKRDKKIFSTTLRPTNRIAAPGYGAGYGNVFGALGAWGLIVYSIPWGILMNGKNSH